MNNSEAVDDSMFFLPPEPPPLIQRVSDNLLNFETPSWLIQSMVEHKSLGAIFGDWNVGKSALAVDIACRIATGLPFAGQNTKKGPVLYIGEEGKRGLQRRFLAWGGFNDVGLEREPSLYLSQFPVRIPDAQIEAELSETVEFIHKQHNSLALVVMDTASATMAGDQKHGADMNNYLASLSRVFPDSAVMLLHHPGHSDKGRGRGASELPAACDWEYRLEKIDKEKNVVRLRNTKQRDEELYNDAYFQLSRQPLGLGDDQRPYGSVVVDHLSDYKSFQQRKGPSKTEEKMLRILKKRIANDYSEQANTDQEGISEEAWITECESQVIKPETVRRLKSRLEDKGYIMIKDKRVMARDLGQTDNP